MKITIHRALSQLKTTEARINNLINETKFVEVTKGKSTTVNGRSITDIEAGIKASYDSIQSLISNYYKLKSAIQRSNIGYTGDCSDLKKYTILGNDYTVQDLINYQSMLSKKGSLKLQSALLRKLSNDLTNAQDQISQGNDFVNDNLETFLNNLAGGNDSKAKLSAEEVDAQSKIYHENHDYKLVDPLGCPKLVSDMRKNLDTFAVEADAILSEANALTTIEVDLTEA